MSKKTGVILLIIAACLAGATAIAHMSCILFGPTCFEAQMAPPYVIQSAIDGTLIAPMVTTFVSGLFLICALYAMSAAGIIRQLPLLGLGIYTISTLCLLRGLAIVPVNFLYPDILQLRDWLAGLIWALVGLCFLFGYRAAKEGKIG